jgi:ketosteroid isomerase-like protein
MAHDDTMDDVLAVAACLKEAMRQKDVPVALSLMTDDVVIVPLHGVPLVGLDAVRAALDSRPLPWKYEVADTTQDVTVEALGNVALVTSERLTVAAPEIRSLPTVTLQGRVISIFRRQVDGWKLARYVSLMAPVTSATASELPPAK